MNLDYALVFSEAAYLNKNVITIIGICLLIGAMAKSSQVGLHVWLPMAMSKKKTLDSPTHTHTKVYPRQLLPSDGFLCYCWMIS